MKIKLLLVFFLLFQLSAIAQQKLVFNYDTAGNQIVRERLCLNCTQVKEQIVESKDSLNLQTKPAIEPATALIAEKEEEEGEEELRISAYPNPVSDVLQVEWIEHPILKPHQLLLFSGEHRQLAQIILRKNQNIQDISFNRYPTGVYILVVVFENGQRRSFQIIKK